MSIKNCLMRLLVCTFWMYSEAHATIEYHYGEPFVDEYSTQESSPPMPFEYTDDTSSADSYDQAFEDSFREPPMQLAHKSSYTSRLPATIQTTEKVIIVDPKKHVWGAYSASGKLIRAGLATAGAKWCDDVGRPCKTKAGVFRIFSLGSSDCYSSKYPLGEGGAPMPYCMYFNGHQGIHGSYQVVEGNISHGCVRVSVDSARWLRFNFVNRGTKVIIKSY